MQNPRSQNLVATAKLAVLGLLLISASTLAASGPSTTEAAPCQQAGAPFEHDLLQHLREKLKLSSQQQAAWTALVQAAESPRAPTPPPAKDWSVADLTRDQAARAQGEAQRLLRISQATQKVWSELDSGQKNIFDRMARPALLHHHRGFQPPHLHPAEDLPPEMN